MRVIVVYDVNTETKEGQKRLHRVMKTLREYLYHVQKSVFEGDLTESQIFELENLLRNLIDYENDSLIIYKIASVKYIERNIIAGQDPLDNII